MIGKQRDLFCRSDPVRQKLFRDEDHELKAYIMDYGFDFGLPAGVEDLEAFVRNPATRPGLWVVAAITPWCQKKTGRRNISPTPECWKEI